jgi:glycine cleavage system transcriptional repressor
MTQALVLTALGPDRPGIVTALSALLSEAGANIEDTRMAKLGGEFAVLILLTGSERILSEVAGLEARISAELGVTCTLKRTQKPPPSGDGLHYHLEVSGFDRPGIVQSITSVLSKQDINVASLTSRVVHAPLSGTPMFMLDADLEVPKKVSLPTLRRDVASACERENLDFSLEPGRA